MAEPFRLAQAGGARRRRVEREDTGDCNHPRKAWVTDRGGVVWCPLCTIEQHLLNLGEQNTWSLARALGCHRPLVRRWLKLLEKTGRVVQVGILPFADAPTEGVAVWRLAGRSR